MKIIIPEHLKGKDYCGSKRIHLGSELSIKDAKFIMGESPDYGVIVVDEPPKKKPRKKGSEEEKEGV